MAKLQNEQLGELFRRIAGIVVNIENDGLDYQRTINALQLVSEGKVQSPEPFRQPRSPHPAPAILEFVGPPHIIPATTEKFVAGRNFLLKRDGGICSYLGENFRRWFLEGDGKVEEPHTETVLRCHKLRKNSVDGPIIAELGGEAVAETTFAEMFALLKKQANGQKGTLLTNGYANIFYVRDQSGLFRAVFAYWHGVGWLVRACEVSHPIAWLAGRRVFSRNPSGSL